MFDVEEIQEQLLGGKGEQGSNEKANVPKYEFEPKQGICEMPGPFDDSKIQIVFVPYAEIDHLNKCWATIMSLTKNPQGLHPKLHQGIKCTRDIIDKMGGEIEQEFSDIEHTNPFWDLDKVKTVALITTSHLNISTTTLLHYPEEDPEDAMLLKQKQGAFSLLTDNIRLKVGGMEKDEDVGPALSMMCSQSNDLTSPINKEALYTSIPTLSTPIHTCALMTESDDPMLFTASPMTPSFPSASLFTPTSTMMANLPYMPMSPDNILHAYAERQKQSQAPVLEMMERVTSPDDMLCAYVERQKAPGIESVTSLDMFILEKYVQVRKSSSCPAWEW
ncbi:hypothetical protein Moror_17164 [Moniliophthora roreri MCA 2997]|uniref:Uncharacterized protein n=1 Tax=Moniliophthora roreri (strain MCA 2997) TaxID=1381753 RepID=V2WXF2_MONRO|nr:hypothetical protein Moror_17164 [Moniliophthora roreri MCA 2997]